MTKLIDMEQTAEEFFRKFKHTHSPVNYHLALIEFAKLHVKAALAAASEKATVDMKEDMDFYYEDYIEGVNKLSILNSYPLKSII